MPAKKKRPITKSKVEPPPPTKLSKREEDLLRHMQHGYQLETSSLWDNSVLRRLKDGVELRADANRGTIEALNKAGLIGVAKDGGGGEANRLALREEVILRLRRPARARFRVAPMLVYAAFADSLAAMGA